MITEAIAENIFPLFLMLFGLLLIVASISNKIHLAKEFLSFEVGNNRNTRIAAGAIGAIMVVYGYHSSDFMEVRRIVQGGPEIEITEPGHPDPGEPDRPKPPISQTPVLQITSWEGPYNQTGYEATDFSQQENGFALGIRKTADALPNLAYGIQVESASAISLGTGGRYKLRFLANSSQAFSLVIRLGERNSPWKSSINDKIVSIQESSGFDVFEQEFTVLDIQEDSYLYFQLGRAPNGTQVEVKDVTFFSVAS